MLNKRSKWVEILLIEDNPGDIRLTQEALKTCQLNCKLNVVIDGEEAMKYLLKEDPYRDTFSPDLILLDLNLPKKNGIEVLKKIKNEPKTKHIPVVVLTSSEADHDIMKCYKLHANCYITKPIEFEDFCNIMNDIEKFWFYIAKLPNA